MLCYFLFHIKITLFWPHKTPRLLTAPAFFNFKEMILRVGHVAGPVSRRFALSTTQEGLTGAIDLNVKIFGPDV